MFANVLRIITSDTHIEKNFICSQAHRAFYQEHVGKFFTFDVAFQKWLKQNVGKTYQQNRRETPVTLSVYAKSLKDTYASVSQRMNELMMGFVKMNGNSLRKILKKS